MCSCIITRFDYKKDVRNVHIAAPTVRVKESRVFCRSREIINIS